MMVNRKEQGSDKLMTSFVVGMWDQECIAIICRRKVACMTEELPVDRGRRQACLEGACTSLFPKQGHKASSPAHLLCLRRLDIQVTLLRRMMG